MATITFNKTGKFVQLGVGDINVDVQELANEIRDWQDEIENLSTPNFLDTSGKGNLIPGVQTGILFKLFNGWKIRADDTFATNTVVVITGDVITDDGSSPFEPVTNVSYDRGFSTAPSIVTVGASGGTATGVEGTRNLQSNC